MSSSPGATSRAAKTDWVNVEASKVYFELGRQAWFNRETTQLHK